MKRGRTQPCFLCEKEGSNNCTGIRPCNRCLAKGMPHMCFGGSPTKRSYPAQSPTVPSPVTENREHDNDILMRELKIVRREHQKLIDQMAEIRQEKQLLEDKVEALAAETRNVGLIMTPPRFQCHPIRGDENIPMVVYRLTEASPVVETANKAFCDLLGCPMNEILGRPWKHIIQAELISRTVEALQSTSQQYVELDQCYKHSSGAGVIVTRDYYTILSDEKGKPHSALVQVQPKTADWPESPLPLSSRAKSIHPYPAPSSRGPLAISNEEMLPDLPEMLWPVFEDTEEQSPPHTLSSTISGGEGQSGGYPIWDDLVAEQLVFP